MSNNKQSSLDNEFVPYEESLALKELGFNEPYLAYWNADPSLPKPFLNLVKPFNHEWCIATPLYRQAFRWFREKYGLYHSIGLDNSTEEDVNCDFNIINHDQSISELETDFKNYEEAELACLRKLIEIVKEKQNG